MWSARSRLGDKGLRCAIHIGAIGKECGRPAVRYAQTVKGFGSEILDAGAIVCCKNHAAILKKQGVTLTVLANQGK